MPRTPCGTATSWGAHPRGGALVLVGDDPAAKSSSVPCASEFALADLVMPFLYPADSAEVLELGRHAVELSRASGLWVGLKIVTSVADGTSTVDLADDRPEPVLPAGAKRHVPTARLLQPTLGPLERDQLTTRLRLARETRGSTTSTGSSGRDRPTGSASSRPGAPTSTLGVAAACGLVALMAGAILYHARAGDNREPQRRGPALMPVALLLLAVGTAVLRAASA